MDNLLNMWISSNCFTLNIGSLIAMLYVAAASRAKPKTERQSGLLEVISKSIGVVTIILEPLD